VSALDGGDTGGLSKGKLRKRHNRKMITILICNTSIGLTGRPVAVSCLV
jgi:hypothetical protein